MPTPRALVLYHGACRDGWCAAWCAHRLGWHDAEFVPCFYGQPPPDVTGRDVLMTDFSFPADTMKVIALRAKSFTVHEHHKTAPINLAGVVEMSRTHRHLHIVFDNERSGAGITWDELSGGQKRPWLVDYIEDRDLWLHRVPDSHRVNALLATLPFDFQTWDNAADSLTAEKAAEYGQYALDKTKQYVLEVCKNARLVCFENLPALCVNAPQVDISELLAAMLAKQPPIAIGWFQRADGMFVYSLRSDGAVDVSELAQRHGGGGHLQAAGFQLNAMLDLPTITL